MLNLPTILLAALGVSQASAHFLLQYPTTVGFSDDTEGTAPCGGSAITFNNVTNFYVDGDAIALESTHPAAVWLFRATLDVTATANWTLLLPEVSQASLGEFCETGVKVPAAWAGQKGIIQIVQDAVDGLLYQCAAVNFVAGAAPSVPSICKNSTGLSAVFTTDAALASLVPVAVGAPAAAPTGSGTTTPAGSGSATAAAPAATTSKGNAAPASMGGESMMGPLFWGAMVTLGAVTAAFNL